MSFDHLGHKLSMPFPSRNVTSGFYSLVRSVYFVLFTLPLMASLIIVVVMMAVVIGLGGRRDIEI